MFTTKNLLLLIGRHALIAFAAVGIGATVVWFLSSEITRVSSDVVKNHQLAGTLEKRTVLLSTIKHDADIVGTNDALIEGAFISSDDISGFVTILEALALKNSLTQTFHFGTPVPTSIAAPFTLAAIPYQNTLSGTLTTFSSYLKEFEGLPYFTKIESITISAPDKATGWRGASTATYSATLYTKTGQ